MGRVRLRLLAIEDDFGMRALINRAATKAGLEVTVAASLADARQKLHTGIYDLLVIDYHLPDGYGSEFIASLVKEDGAAPPSILVTATPDAIPREELDLFVEVLPKPFKLDAFNQLLNGLRSLARPTRKRSGVVLKQAGSIDEADANGTDG